MQQRSAVAKLLRPLQRSDLARLSAFLTQVFRVPKGASFASEDMLEWKYLSHTPRNAEGLSYVLDKAGTLTAHIGVCPVVFQNPHGEQMVCTTAIDWAADPEAPGAGVVAYRHAMQLAEVTFLIGGTPMTWEFSRRLGFRTALEARVYARWVRPLREFRLREKTPRALARLLHSVTHPPFGKLASAQGWTIESVTAFDDRLQPVLLRSDRSFTSAVRTVAQINHRLACPGVPTRGYILHKSGAVAGYAIAALGDWEAKIVDAQSIAHGPEDWAAIYALLTSALRREPSVCRVRAMASVPVLQEALEANSYWVNTTEPVCFFDPKGLTKDFLPLDLQFFESDLAYDSA